MTADEPLRRIHRFLPGQTEEGVGAKGGGFRGQTFPFSLRGCQQANICYRVAMARPIRIEYEGAVYHVTIRGNERKALFSTDADRGES